MLGKYYLYRHIRLDKNEPFYIGVGTKMKDYYNHYVRANSKVRNNIWYKITKKTGYRVDIIMEHNDIKFIKEREVEFIKLYGRIDKGTGILCNLTDGGESNAGKITTDTEKLRRKTSALNQWSKLSIGERNKILIKVRESSKIKTINIKTGEIFESIAAAYRSQEFKISPTYFSNMVSERDTNFTDFKLLK